MRSIASANEFVRRAKPAFRAISLHAMRRWSTPVWLSVEDVEQDVTLAAWLAVERYSEEIGAAHDVSLRGYVAYNAYDAAKKKIHKARLGRRPHRGEGSEKSRFEFTASSFNSAEGGDERESPLDRVSTLPDQDDSAARRLLFQKLVVAEDGSRSARVLMALAEVAGESVEAAGMALYSDPDARVFYGLNNEDAAIALVARVVDDVYHAGSGDTLPESTRAA